jgi:Zn-dependent protease with chaperone function
LLFLRSFLIFTFLISVFSGYGQGKTVHEFWKDDTVLQERLYKQTLAKKRSALLSAEKESYAKDYKMVYESHYNDIAGLWNSTRPVTSKEAYNYLQSIVQKIIAANPQLKETDARVVFTRDEWPNAVSMGDGTIVINAGLVIYLANESELVFVICHELSHYYLDHSNKKIRQMVERYNSEAFKKEIKKLSKEEYGVRQKLEDLLKAEIFGTRRHSRENEAEADLQAFRFMKNTGYDCDGITSCLQLLKHVDDTSMYKPFVPEAVFHFDSYPFKKKWIEKTSSIFAQMDPSDSPLTQEEKDSLHTHPDCDKRIRLLQDSIAGVSAGEKFLVNEAYFNHLKRELFLEMSEQNFRNDNLPRNLYYNLQMLQNEEALPLAVYSIVRDLNTLYQKQKDHKLGEMDKEGRTYPADYNLLLRMIDRWKLPDIAALSYLFCKKYEEEMKGYDGFAEEQKNAQQHMMEQKYN